MSQIQSSWIIAKTVRTAVCAAPRSVVLLATVASLLSVPQLVLAQDIVLNNMEAMVFEDASGANDGTEIRRFAGNALRLRYAGNSLTFDALDDLKFNLRNSAGDLVFSVNPDPDLSRDLLILNDDTHPALLLKASAANHSLRLAVAPSSGNYSPLAGSGDAVLRGFGGGVVLHANQGAIRFGTEATEKMTIGLDGKVGIGTSAPQEQLDVNGTMRAKEVVVTTEDWPDYVFAEDYDLMPLEELAEHLRQRNHLPGIPSAAEVEQRGVSVGEMQARLLEKVEELTLYVLDLSQDHADLRARLESVEKGHGETAPERRP